MGVSPWKTKFQLYEEKVGLRESFQGNYATERGNRLEPQARAHYELLNDRDMPPLLVMHETYPFLRAALDGANLAAKLCLEIKCPGEEDHEKALSGEVPEKYYPQVQHQLLVSGFQKCHYFSFYEGKGALVEVAPDFPYLERLLKEELLFWQCVTSKTPPELSDKDYSKIKEKDLLTLLEQWKEAEMKAKAWQALADETREKILPQLTHKRCRGAGVRIFEVSRKGAIDYSKIPELKSIDLEVYRKLNSISVRFQIEGDEGDA